MSSSDSAPFAAVPNFYSVLKCCLLSSMLIVVIGHAARVEGVGFVEQDA